MQKFLVMLGLVTLVGCNSLGGSNAPTGESDPEADKVSFLKIQEDSYRAYKAAQLSEPAQPTKQKPRPLYTTANLLLYKKSEPEPVDPLLIPAPKYLALTFDDGPHQKHTPAVLDILKEKQVKASFFVVGELAAKQPSLLIRLRREGHELGNHSYDHSLKRWSSIEQILLQVEQGDLIIAEITGQKPTAYRPPYGYIHPDLKAAINRPIVMWSLDSNDWRIEDPVQITTRVTRLAQRGDIIVMHDTKPQTVLALGPLIDQLKSEGYQFVTVSELLGLTQSDKLLTQGEIYYYSQEPTHIPVVNNFE